ncbi:hypothetical protein HanIR_Chr15g0757061 [Helianthus annuus]|nr:hypothetical protein HanIR_Chr15g0757061 [Helianthus annuus]
MIDLHMRVAHIFNIAYISFIHMTTVILTSLIGCVSCTYSIIHQHAWISIVLPPVLTNAFNYISVAIDHICWINQNIQRQFVSMTCECYKLNKNTMFVQTHMRIST